MGNMSVRAVLSGILWTAMLLGTVGCGDVAVPQPSLIPATPAIAVPVNPFSISLACLSRSGMRLSCSVQAVRGGEVWTNHIARTQWDFGDGATAEGTPLTVDHTYTGGWMYNVGVTATDDAGATSSRLMTMYVAS